MATQNQLMQVRAAARELGVHENTLRRWEEAGLIDAIRLPSGVRRFRVDDVNELRTQMYKQPTPRQRLEAELETTPEASRAVAETA